MLLGFQSRFVPFVLDGTKTHTIRAIRKNPPRVGEICHCYANPRQRTMRLLGRWPCVAIEKILIYERGDGTFGVVIEGEELSIDEKDQLACRDGFRSKRIHRGAFAIMMRYWMATHGNEKRTTGFDFEGQIIHWNWNVPADARKQQHGTKSRLSHNEHEGG